MCWSIIPLIRWIGPTRLPEETSPYHDGTTLVFQCNFCKFEIPSLFTWWPMNMFSAVKRFILLLSDRSTYFYWFIVHYLWLIANCFIRSLFGKLANNFLRKFIIHFLIVESQFLLFAILFRGYRENYNDFISRKSGLKVQRIHTACT